MKHVGTGDEGRLRSEHERGAAGDVFRRAESAGRQGLELLIVNTGRAAGIIDVVDVVGHEGEIIDDAEYNGFDCPAGSTTAGHEAAWQPLPQEPPGASSG